MNDDVEMSSEDPKVRQVHAATGETVEVPVDDTGDTVVFWLDIGSDVPGNAIRNAKGQVLTTLVKLPNGYVTVPVDADRTPLNAPIAGIARDT